MIKQKNLHFYIETYQTSDIWSGMFVLTLKASRGSTL